MPTLDKQGYYRIINYENILANQINRIAERRSNKEIEKYEESVDTLIFMLPLKIRKDALKYKKDHDIKYGISATDKAKYDDLWQYVNELMENSKPSLIFKIQEYTTYQM